MNQTEQRLWKNRTGERRVFSACALYYPECFVTSDDQRRVNWEHKTSGMKKKKNRKKNLHFSGETVLGASEWKTGNIDQCCRAEQCELCNFERSCWQNPWPARSWQHRKRECVYLYGWRGKAVAVRLYWPAVVLQSGNSAILWPANGFNKLFSDPPCKKEREKIENPAFCLLFRLDSLCLFSEMCC